MQYNLATLSKDHTRNTAKKRVDTETENLISQTLFRDTYLHSLYMGVPPSGSKYCEQEVDYAI